MARLDGLDYRGGARWFSITPVAPSLIGPKDAYDIAFWPDESGATFGMRGNVHKWQLDHYYLWRIAETFSNADKIASHRIPTNVQGMTAHWDWEVCQDCEWLRLQILPPQKRPIGSPLRIVLFARVETSDDRAKKRCYERFDMLAKVECMIDFGRVLHAELEDAKAARALLGLGTQNDELR